MMGKTWEEMSPAELAGFAAMGKRALAIERERGLMEDRARQAEYFGEKHAVEWERLARVRSAKRDRGETVDDGFPVGVEPQT